MLAEAANSGNRHEAAVSKEVAEASGLSPVATAVVYQQAARGKAGGSVAQDIAAEPAGRELRPAA